MGDQLSVCTGIVRNDGTTKTDNNNKNQNARRKAPIENNMKPYELTSYAQMSSRNKRRSGNINDVHDVHDVSLVCWLVVVTVYLVLVLDCIQNK